MPETIISNTRFLFDESKKKDSSSFIKWEEGLQIDQLLSMDNEPIMLFNSLSLFNYGEGTVVDIDFFIVYDNDFNKINVVNNLEVEGSMVLHDINWSVVYDNDLKHTDVDVALKIVGKIDIHEISHTLVYDNDLENIKTVANTPWQPRKVADIPRPIRWGYSINNFLIGGRVIAPHLTDIDAIDHPLLSHWSDLDVWTDSELWIDGALPSEGVIKIVNVVNIVTLPSRTPISFTDLNLSTDLDSYSWVVNFVISDLATLALIKPVGLSVKEVEININGEIFNVFIGRTQSQLSVKGDIVQRRIKIVGWSNIKRLSYPYSPKKSYTELTTSTPPGLVTFELSGTGFTHTWDTVSWSIPGKVYGYVDKPIISAIIDLALSVGAVIIPHQSDNSFTVKPYYPISPWNWDVATPDRLLSENVFFTVDIDQIPQESPDSIFVYGEENGVGVKAVRQGTAGLITLPTIVDKHITDVIAGTERGRIEVAKNGFKEVIPVTTFVDVVGGIIKPQELLEITELGGSKWRGMVTSVSVALSRNGNAITQSLNIERFIT